MGNKFSFDSDYTRGAHPNIMQRLMETNMDQTPGYGLDEISESAKARIREACGCPDAMIQFLVGGTQANVVMIDAFLKLYEGVIAADTGHINTHEAGAVESGGHKVLALPHTLGKLSAETLRNYLYDFHNDGNREHMVYPGMIYISQPTEYGTLYSKEELTALRRLCDEYNLALYVDGARLAYALSCPENDVSLRDLAALSDAFYIGGTKCGALFGEAVVVPDPNRMPMLFTITKQHGALLAKGRLLGIQFDELFKDGLYERIGKTAIHYADKIRAELDARGYRQAFAAPTNQIYVVMENEFLKSFGTKVEYCFWEKYDERHTTVRLATDWATSEDDVEKLLSFL